MVALILFLYSATLLPALWYLLRHVIERLLDQQAAVFTEALKEVGQLQADVSSTVTLAVTQAIVSVLQALPQFAPSVMIPSTPNDAEDIYATPWHQVPQHDAYGESIDPTDALMPDPLDIRDFAAMINPDDPNATGIAGFSFDTGDGQNY